MANGPLKVFLFATVIIALLQPACLADSDDSWIEVLHKTGDTDKVYPYVKSGLSGIPKSIKDDLVKNGYKIIVTPSMLYGKSNSSSSAERRSEYDVNDSNTAGRFVGSEKTLYIPERCSYRNEPARLQDDDLVHVTRHELGHAYDCLQSWPSSKTTFAEAYADDSGKLTNSQRTECTYFTMQNPGTNQIELFAELFSIICSPDDTTLRSYDKSLYEAFPHCVAAILALSPDLRPHTFSGNQTRANAITPRDRNSPGPSSPNSSQAVVPSSNPLKMGTALILARRYAEAVQSFDAVLLTDPKNSFAYSSRAYANLALGKYQQSINDYEMALKLNPNDQSATANLALARSMQKKYANRK